jgi:hypothetical protein
VLVRHGLAVPGWKATRNFVAARPALAGGIALALAALILRAVALGQPEVDVDEQFYLLVGDRMLRGAIPYVGIWDRKPVGLFLIYAAARAIGGSGIIQYQILALISAAATAWTIRVSALRLGASEVGAWLSGLTYLLWIDLLGGVGGQAPVFFNLPMAVAGGLIIGQFASQTRSRTELSRAGLWCMLLVGIAIQIKYTALFEGMFFGLALLFLTHRDRWPLAGTALFASGLITLALTPTAAALTVYWSIGHLHEFVFANFLSIGARLPLPEHEVFHRAATLSLVLVPLLSLGLLGLRYGLKLQTAPQRQARGFLLVWLSVAIASVIGLGYFFDHYGLPVAVPAAILAAPFLSMWRKFGFYILGLFVIACVAGQALALDEISSSGGWRTIRAIESAAPDLRNCPFVYDGPAVIYVLDHWCTPTIYPFPYHLSYYPESGALGVKTLDELKRIMTEHPDAVLIRSEPYPNENLAARALMLRELRRNYVSVRSTPFHQSELVIFRLKPGVAPQPNDVTNLVR